MKNESVLLRVRLQKATKYLLVIHRKYYSASITDKINYEISTVKDAQNEGFKIETEIDKIEVKFHRNNTIQTYDSSQSIFPIDKETRTMYALMKSALDTVIVEDVSTTGIVSNRKKTKGQLSAQKAKQITNVIALPLQPVTIGTTWVQDVLEGKIIVEYTYTVEDITATSVLLDCVGKPEVMFKGNIHGKIELDRETGIPVKKDFKFNLNLNEQSFKTDILTVMTKM